MKITKKHLLAFCLSFIYFSAMLMISQPAGAAGSLWGSQQGVQDIGTNAYGTLEPEDIRVTVVKIINTVLLFLGIIMLCLVLFAGFKYMTSGGNEQKVTEAMGYIKNSTIGLLIVMSAWAISYALLARLRAITLGRVNYLYAPWF